MKAIRLYQYGPAENLKFEENVPEPELSPNAVLIQAAATSINPIDWKVRSGARQKDFPLLLPAILGRDVSGIVRAVGNAVHNFKVGDPVAALTNAAYAQLVVVDAAVVTHLPSGVDLIDAAAIPLATLTGDQLIRLATRAQPGQTIVVSGALGSVGRSAVHSATKLGARVIAAVRARQLSEARELNVADTVAVDDADSLARLSAVDGVADTVGGDIAVRLFSKIKAGGSFGYASVLPEGTAALNPSVTITRVFARPDAATVRAFADDVRDGKFKLPISLRLPLHEAARGHVLMERGGAGKIILVSPA